MDTKKLFDQVIAKAGAAIARANTSELSKSTPCSEWDLRALINHMVYEVAWIPDMLEGKDFRETGELHEGDLLADNHLAAWQRAAHDAKLAIDKTPLSTKVRMSVGEAMAEDYIREVAFDVLIHGWDVSQALGEHYEMEAELLDFAETMLDPLEERYGQFGVFGNPVKVDPAVDKQTKLLARMGRQADTWRKAV